MFSSAPQFSRAESFQKFIQQEQPFALVESFIAGDESEINSYIEENRIPLIGAISLFPRVDPPIDRYVFYLLSGFQEQSEALARFAASNQGLKAARSLVVFNRKKESRRLSIGSPKKRRRSAGRALNWCVCKQ